MSQGSHLTDCGLRELRWIPYGLHACHFYERPGELAETLIPYLLAGLYLGERCLWLAAPPLPAPEAREALQAAWNGTARAIAAGTLRIVDFAEWHADGAEPRRLIDRLLLEEAGAVRDGHRGLRVSMIMAGYGAAAHRALHEHERLVSRGLTQRRIVALCSYPRRTDGHGDDTEAAHHCTFDRMAEGGWQIRWPPGPSTGSAAPS